MLPPRIPAAGRAQLSVVAAASRDAEPGLMARCVRRACRDAAALSKGPPWGLHRRSLTLLTRARLPLLSPQHGHWPRRAHPGGHAAGAPRPQSAPSHLPKPPLAHTSRLATLSDTLLRPVQTAQVSAAVASELDVLTTPTPTTGFVLDDARILSKSAAAELNSLAASIEKDTVRLSHLARQCHAVTDVWRSGVPRGCGDAAQAAVRDGRLCVCGQGD
jgi:hypothetical protein